MKAELMVQIAILVFCAVAVLACSLGDVMDAFGWTAAALITFAVGGQCK